jgi:hypothetical protein
VTASLAGPRAKTERAEKHIRELGEAVGGLVFSASSHPHVISRERDPASGHTMYKPVEVPAVPDEVAPIAGDAIHNLHAALDLLMTQLVERAGNMPANRVTPYFPSGNGRESFEARLTPKVEALIGKDAVDCIRAAEPYRGGKGEAAWYVHHLDVEDKHRVLYALGINLDAHTIPISNASAFGAGFDSFTPEARAELIRLSGEFFWNPGPGYTLAPLQEGVPILIVPGEPQNDPKFRFEVAFSEPEIVKTKPVLPSLMEYAQATTALIESFAPLF